MVFRPRFLMGLTGLVTCALAAICGCRTPERPPLPPLEDNLLVRNAFVGSAACAECHPARAKTHAATRHAATLRIMDPQSMGAQAPPVGPIPGTDYTLVQREGRFWVALTRDPKKADSIDLAFGSGKNGLTFAAVMGNALAEVRMSYEPRTHRWFLTPGQEEMKDRKLGKIHRGEFARRCVLCHSVALPDDRAMPAARFLGVGCESCHGPGGDHITAMRAGRKENLRIGRLSQASADDVNAVCNRCHTVGQPASDGDLETSEAATRRFPLFGLQKSQCFQKSGRTMSCLHCHDPHARSSPDPKVFEAACLRCHGAAPPHDAGKPITPGKPCPVNARSGCIDCHMPLGLVMPDSQSTSKVRDHFIRIHRPKSARR